MYPCLSYPACKLHTPWHIATCGLSVCPLLFHIISLTIRFLKKKKKYIHHKMCFGFHYNLFFWKISILRKFSETSWKIGWRERKQQGATNLMFIIKLLSQHVSGIIMPIIRRTRVCTAAYEVLHWLWLLSLCGAGTRAVCTVKVNCSNSNFHSAHSSRPSSTQPQPSQPVQNTIRRSAHSCSPDDGHNDARNMLR